MMLDRTTKDHLVLLKRNVVRNQGSSINRKILRFHSTAFVRRLLDKRRNESALAEIREFAPQLVHAASVSTVADFYSACFRMLKSDYRVEVVYKEALLNWWVNRSGNRARSGVMFEMRAGASKLDVLCVGRDSTAFEIKTNYDAPRRLDGQLVNYRVRFPKVFVLVSEAAVDKLIDYVPAGVGVMLLNSSGGLDLHLDAVVDAHWLDPRAMISVLRRGELLQLASSLGADLHAIPNTRFLAEVISLVEPLDPLLLSKLVSSRLLERTSALSTQSLRALQPGLRSLAIGAGVTDKQFQDLGVVLYERI